MIVVLSSVKLRPKADAVVPRWKCSFHQLQIVPSASANCRHYSYLWQRCQGLSQQTMQGKGHSGSPLTCDPRPLA